MGSFPSQTNEALDDAVLKKHSNANEVVTIPPSGQKKISNSYIDTVGNLVIVVDE